MSVLVTGGAGFIGSHLIERLLRDTDYDVVCLDNFNDYYDPTRKRSNIEAFADNPRVILVEDDFCNPEVPKGILADNRIRYIVHLGGYAGVRYSVDHPLIYQQTNVCGTLNLLEAARQHPVERFLFASSSTVYGKGATAPFVEDATLGTPLSPYGASKRAGELLCQTYCLLHGIPTVSLRLFSVYGPRLRPDLALAIFTGQILAGKRIPLYGDGTVRRDFTHVDDICSGFLAALKADAIVGGAINLGHDHPIQIKELIELIEQQTGQRAQIDQRLAESSDMPLTHADLTKARQLLNYRPRVAIETGIKQYVDWFRASHRSSGPSRGDRGLVFDRSGHGRGLRGGA